MAQESAPGPVCCLSNCLSSSTSSQRFNMSNGSASNVIRRYESRPNTCMPQARPRLCYGRLSRLERPQFWIKDRLADPSQRVGSSSLLETVPAARQVYSASSHLDISLQYVYAFFFPRSWACPSRWHVRSLIIRIALCEFQLRLQDPQSRD